MSALLWISGRKCFTAESFDNFLLSLFCKAALMYWIYVLVTSLTYIAVICF